MYIQKWFITIKNIFINFLCTYIKMGNKYYQKDKQMLRKEARKRYQNLSEEEKEKKGGKRLEIDIKISLKKK